MATPTVPPRRLIAQAVQAYVDGIVGLGLVADVLGTDSLTEIELWLRERGFEGFEPTTPERVDIDALV